jgi:hypothetical protein
MKRMAILWLVESLFGSRGKRVDWSLTLMLVGIALTFWLLLAVY